MDLVGQANLDVSRTRLKRSSRAYNMLRNSSRFNAFDNTSVPVLQWSRGKVAPDSLPKLSRWGQWLRYENLRMVSARNLFIGVRVARMCIRVSIEQPHSRHLTDDVAEPSISMVSANLKTKCGFVWYWWSHLRVPRYTVLACFKS